MNGQDQSTLRKNLITRKGGSSRNCRSSCWSRTCHRQEHRCRLGRRRRCLAHPAGVLSQQRRSGREYWVARTVLPWPPTGPCPETSSSPCAIERSGKEYWDNNHGANHAIQADSGIRWRIWPAALNSRLRGQPGGWRELVPIVVAVDDQLAGQERDACTGPATTGRARSKTPCRFARNYWDESFSATREIPTTTAARSGMRAEGGRRLSHQYRISCETRQRNRLGRQLRQELHAPAPGR
jgi:hypothetical protein